MPKFTTTSPLTDFINTDPIPAGAKSLFPIGQDLEIRNRYSFPGINPASVPPRFQGYNFTRELAPGTIELPSIPFLKLPCSGQKFTGNLSALDAIQAKAADFAPGAFAITRNNQYIFWGDRETISGQNFTRIRTFPVSGNHAPVMYMAPIPEIATPGGMGFVNMCADQTEYFEFPPRVIGGNTGMHFDKSVNVLIRRGLLTTNEYAVFKMGVSESTPERLWFMPVLPWGFEKILFAAIPGGMGKFLQIADIESRPGVIYLAGGVPAGGKDKYLLIVMRWNMYTGKTDYITQEVPLTEVTPTVRIAIDHSRAFRGGETKILVLLHNLLFVVDGTSKTGGLKIEKTHAGVQQETNMQHQVDINASCGLCYMSTPIRPSSNDLVSYQYSDWSRVDSLSAKTRVTLTAMHFSLTHPQSAFINCPPRSGIIFATSGSTSSDTDMNTRLFELTP